MTRTTKIIGIGAILLAGLTTVAFAQGLGGGGHKGFKNGLPPIPDLTQEQKQKITDLKTTAMQQSPPLHEQIVTIRKDIRALWTADSLVRAAITKKEAEAEGLMQKVKGIWTDFFFQLHDVLTPAQRTWLAQHGPGKDGHFGGPGMGLGAEGSCPCATPQP
jgi:Spy/CpxP family protein refolding chaperone